MTIAVECDVKPYSTNQPNSDNVVYIYDLWPKYYICQIFVILQHLLTSLVALALVRGVCPPRLLRGIRT